MTKEVKISKEIEDAADWCFSILKKAGHFKGCNGAWEKRQIELALYNHADLQTASFREERDILSNQVDNIHGTIVQLKEELEESERSCEKLRRDHQNILSKNAQHHKTIGEYVSKIHSLEQRVREIKGIVESTDINRYAKMERIESLLTSPQGE